MTKTFRGSTWRSGAPCSDIDLCIPACINNHMPNKVWAYITFPFPDFIGATVDVWVRINNFTPYFIMDVIASQCSQVNPCYKIVKRIPLRTSDVNYVHFVMFCWVLMYFRTCLSFTTVHHRLHWNKKATLTTLSHRLHLPRPPQMQPVHTKLSTWLPSGFSV